MAGVVLTAPVESFTGGVERGGRIGLSISVRLGEYDGQTSPEDITSRSDEALYSAKQAGKNTVRILQSSRRL
ncbi:MAG TPA: GGDEF domain-containing protein [Sedimentisphaerales bacterium]|nr:GGDEF domain-containing protein [Sedimentisphaerales bacterium]